MIHKKNTCQCCGKQTSQARIVNSGHLLCSSDNVRLLLNGSLRLDENTMLRIVGQRGDFKIVKAFSEPIESY